MITFQGICGFFFQYSFYDSLYLEWKTLAGQPEVRENWYCCLPNSGQHNSQLQRRLKLFSAVICHLVRLNYFAFFRAIHEEVVEASSVLPQRVLQHFYDFKKFQELVHSQLFRIFLKSNQGLVQKKLDQNLAIRKKFTIHI